MAVVAGAGAYRVPMLWPAVRIETKRAKEDLGWRPTPLGEWLGPTVQALIQAHTDGQPWPEAIAYQQRLLEIRAAQAWRSIQDDAARRLTEAVRDFSS